jgi:putative membrane protein
VALVGNLLQWLLHHHQQATLGFLLGLLIGSVAGLWPFQQGIPPQPGDMIKGQVVTVDSIDEIEAEDWKMDFFVPSPLQAICSLGLIGLGFALTLGVARIGRQNRPSADNAATAQAT